MIHCDGNIRCPDNYYFMNQVGYIRRAGIIPAMVVNNETYLLIGLSKDDQPVWADLGGRAEKGETTLQTALREFGEESRWVMPVDMNRLKHVLITSRNNTSQNNTSQNNTSRNNPDQVLFVVEVDPTPYNIGINQRFQQTIPRNQYEDEMQFLQWFPFTEFINLGGMTQSMQSIQRLLSL